MLVWRRMVQAARGVGGRLGGLGSGHGCVGGRGLARVWEEEWRTGRGRVCRSAAADAGCSGRRGNGAGAQLWRSGSAGEHETLNKIAYKQPPLGCISGVAGGKGRFDGDARAVWTRGWVWLHKKMRRGRKRLGKTVKWAAAAQQLRRNVALNVGTAHRMHAQARRLEVQQAFCIHSRRGFR